MASIPRGQLSRLLLCRILALHNFRERSQTRHCLRCGRRERLLDIGGGHDGPLWAAAPFPHQVEKPEGGA
ncbi:MAG: hypothetical protein F9K44_03640 [Hyphomicrobiaceae bacterium]|nr:MAG: hypothetical protein F9K44_03640 [Hyphomicrobiaceae bacterium]